jgi:hypothetical protein
MNTRRQLYKANRIKGMNQYNAARAAGYSETYSRQACRVEELVKVSMTEAFEQAGITDKYLVQHAIDGLNANRTVSAIITGKDAGAADKDFIDVPDWTARHKYYDTILKLTERMKDKLELSGHVKVTKMDTIVKGSRLMEYNLG